MSSQVSEAREVKLPDDYCETVAAVSGFLAAHASHTKDDSIQQGREISSREAAHWKGEAYSDLNGRQPIFALLGYDDIRSLEGKLLTIVDASFSDQQQRKAVKDLVRNALWFNWAPNLDTDDRHVGKPDLNR